MKTLQNIWDESPLKSDKGNIHSYLPVYEEVLSPYRTTANNILEIGIFNGASLLLWEKYFTIAKVYGIDCDEEPHGGLADLKPLIAEGTHNIIIGDATSDADIEKLFGGIVFDFVCDDGNHHLGSQLKTFHLLKNKMAKGGLYCIEDVQSIDTDRNLFENIDPNYTVEILDRRHIKDRYDDVLCIIKGF